MKKLLGAALFIGLFIGLLIGSTSWAGATGGTGNKIQWVDWTNGLFETAKKENKFVILDLEAVWCHWCHVMEKETYSNPKIIETIQKHFIAVKVDQDARPDISRRYEDYGWPATIFFDSTGKEVAKRSGFIPPGEMAPLLEAIVNKTLKEVDRKIANTIPESPFFTKATREELVKDHQSRYDGRLGGWGKIHKFLFGDTEEFALRSAWRGDKKEGDRAKKTLTAALSLIDPVWGGVYQYSVENWKEPHFEKIAESQMKNLVLYSAGYLLYNDPKYLKAAQDIRRFLNTFMKSPEGAYYTSQDADLIPGVHSEGYFKLNDKDRRAKGIPRLDKNVYARENGWYISGLCALYAASKEKAVLDDAVTAAQWVEKNRSLGKGGFSHGAKDTAGPFLGDTLEMGNAMMNLYQVTGDRQWLEKAKRAANFIQEKFSHKIGGKEAGYVTSAQGISRDIASEPMKDENIRVVRFANLLAAYTGDIGIRKIAEQGMRYLASSEIASTPPTAGVLLAEQELSEKPVHLTIVGSKSAPESLALFQAANAYPVTYKRVDWWDKSEGNLPNPDVQYPQLSKPAAFVCKENRCSLPITNPADLKAKVDQLYG